MMKTKLYRYVVLVRDWSIIVQGPYGRVTCEDAPVPASYRCAGRTYHVVRERNGWASDAAIANAVINHAQSLGFRGLSVVDVRAQRAARRAKKRTPADTSTMKMFDDEGDDS